MDNTHLLTSRKSDILHDIQAALSSEGFNIASIGYRPESNYRYDNGIMSYNLVLEVTWG